MWQFAAVLSVAKVNIGEGGLLWQVVASIVSRKPEELSLVEVHCLRLTTVVVCR